MDFTISNNAAFEAHMAVSHSLEEDLRRTPSKIEIACALAKAYGDALALVSAEHNSKELFAGINTICEDAAVETLTIISEPDRK